MRTKPTTNDEESAPSVLRAKAVAFKAVNRRVDTRLSNNMDVAKRVIAEEVRYSDTVLATPITLPQLAFLNGPSIGSIKDSCSGTLGDASGLNQTVDPPAKSRCYPARALTNCSEFETHPKSSWIVKREASWLLLGELFAIGSPVQSSSKRQW
jgi:hypothetical protein